MRITKYTAVFLLVAMTVLNFVPMSSQHGSMAFSEEWVEGFEPSRGFPFRWWTRGNDEGTHQIDGSNVQGDSRYRGNVFPGTAYPHLCWNAAFLVMNAAVFFTGLFLVFVIHRKASRRTCRTSRGNR